MKLKQVLLDHKFHKLSRSFCFQKLNPNIFQSKSGISCSTAGFKDVAVGDRRKITKMAIESSEMVGFHFLKKEKKLQLKPDRMSYSYLGGKLNIFRSKIDICVKTRTSNITENRH